eukprot:tig00021015_g17162.t1
MNTSTCTAADADDSTLAWHAQTPLTRLPITHPVVDDASLSAAGWPQPVVYVDFRPESAGRGPSTFRLIGEAVAAIGGTGTVVVRPGTYAEDRPLRIKCSGDLAIVADGPGVTLLPSKEDEERDRQSKLQQALKAQFDQALASASYRAGRPRGGTASTPSISTQKVTILSIEALEGGRHDLLIRGIEVRGGGIEISGWGPGGSIAVQECIVEGGDLLAHKSPNCKADFVLEHCSFESGGPLRSLQYNSAQSQTIPQLN